MINIVIQILTIVFPWCIRKTILKTLCRFEIGKGSRIGYSIILAKKVHLGVNARIGHFNICKSIDALYLDDGATIGNKNYITGFSVHHPLVIKHGHFLHIKNRKCELYMGKNASITSRHYFDCNGGVYLGDFCQIAGFETSFVSHSIDLKDNRQDAQPIHVGDYTFIGTRCTLLKGSTIPAKSIVGACSLVNKQLEKTGLYAGAPARFIKEVQDYKFFQRKEGFVK